MNKNTSYRFCFYVDGNEIEGQGSIWGGMERVLVNGDVVSEKRSLTLGGIHEFSIGPNQYHLIFKVKSVILGEMLCVLRKNGTDVKALLADPKVYDLDLLDFIASLMFLFAYWYAEATFGFPEWMIFVFIGIGLVLGVVVKDKTLEVTELPPEEIKL